MPKVQLAEAPKTVYEIPDDLMEMIKETFAFVEKHKTHIDEQYKRWYKLKDAAEYLGVSKNHLIQNLKDEITPSQRGRSLMYDRKDLDAFWENRKLKRNSK